MAEEFPFTTPEGSDAEMFIQWKGTKVCLDFRCPCGASGHIDDDFVYWVKCPACGSVYRMGTQVIAKKVPDPTAPPPGGWGKGRGPDPARPDGRVKTFTQDDDQPDDYWATRRSAT